MEQATPSFFHQALNAFIGQTYPNTSFNPNLAKLENQIKEALKEVNLPFNTRIFPAQMINQDLGLSHFHPSFLDLSNVKYYLIDAPLLSLYASFQPRFERVALLTFIFHDGLGDFYTQQDVAMLLNQEFPELKLTLVTLFLEGMPTPPPIPYFPHILIPYTKNKEGELRCKFPQKTLEALRRASLIFECPTHYPHMSALIKDLHALERKAPFPLQETLLETGFINHAFRMPPKGSRSMGLHFLEKGLLFPSLSLGKNGQNKKRAYHIIKSFFPLIKKDSLTHLHLHFAYTRNETGLASYLHGLLRWKDNCALPIMVAIFKPYHLLKCLHHHFEIEKKEHSLLASMQIASIEIITPDEKKTDEDSRGREKSELSSFQLPSPQSFYRTSLCKCRFHLLHRRSKLK